jgi:hypothetical protein
MIGDKPVGQEAWSALPKVKGERFAAVSVDEKTAPAAGSAAAGQAEPLSSVTFDLHGHRRPGNPTAGAIEIAPLPDPK